MMTKTTAWVSLLLATFVAGAVTQTNAACTYDISPANRNHGYAGATNTVVLTTGAGCPWTIANTNSWISFPAGTNGTDSATNTYVVAANLSSMSRSGSVSIGGQLFTVQQAGVPCSYSLSPVTRTHGYGLANNTITVQAGTNCAWTATNAVPWIVFTGLTNAVGTNTVPYTVQLNQTPVQRTGNVFIADQTFVLIQHAAPCLYELSPTNRSHGYAGSTGMVTVTTSSTCIWNVNNTNDWITITVNSNGAGSGTFGYSVGPNPTSSPRSGLFTVWDEVFMVFQQPAPCTYSITPSSWSPSAETGTNAVTLNAVGGCAWSVVNTNDWITATPSNGIGSASVACVIAGNTATLGRTGVVNIAGQNFTVRQGAANCTYLLSPTNRMHGYGATTNSVAISTLSVCAWNIINTNSWITFSLPTNGAGNATLTYSLAVNSASGDRSGVVWIGGQPFYITQHGLGCAINLSPASRSHGFGAASNALTVSIGSGCSWDAINTNSWITIVSNSSGVGSNVVGYTIAANPTAFARTGYITVEEGVTMLTQAGAPCTYSITPASFTHGAGQETGTVSVTSVTGCNWLVSNTNTWITILSDTNGAGSTNVIYRVDANLNSGARSGTFTIDGQTYTVNQNGATCSYKLSPTTRTHGYAAVTNSVSVTVSNPCPWSVDNTNSWITILSGASGAGTGVVTYAVSANSLSPADRIGALMIGGQFLTITQHGVPCSYSLTPTTRTHGYGAAANSFLVTTTNGCPWFVGNTNTWIAITAGASGAASGTVGYTVDANTSLTDRIGFLTVDGQTFTITQRASLCTFDLSPTNRNHGYGATTGSVSVSSAAGCTWPVVNTNAWITLLSTGSGSGDGTVSYSVSSNIDLEPRSGTITIGDQNFAVNQSAYLCTYKLSPTNRTHGFGANTGLVSVTAGPSCTWSVVNTNDWIGITSGDSGVGNGSFTYTINANFGAATRAGVIVVADQALTISQLPATGGFSFELINVGPNGEVTVRLAGGPPGIWELQASPDLQAWTKIADLTNTTGRVEYIIPSPGADKRFYRAMLP